MNREQKIADLRERRDGDRDHLAGRTLGGQHGTRRERQGWASNVAEFSQQLRDLGAEE